MELGFLEIDNKKVIKIQLLPSGNYEAWIEGSNNKYEARTITEALGRCVRNNLLELNIILDIS